MVYRLTYLKDVLGNNYIGLDVDENIVVPFLSDMEEILGKIQYSEYINNQKKRDGDKYHLTLINVAECNNLYQTMGVDKFVNSVELIFDYPIDDLKFMGLGKASKNENTAYFVVCKSEKLQAVRKRFGLDEKDLHITIGFKHKDVFGVSKSDVINKKPKFLKKLYSEYIVRENWEFIKKIENYTFTKQEELIPILIGDSLIKFRVGGYYIDIGWVDEFDSFRILTKYPVDIELPRMPKTEIIKKFNNI